MFSRYSITNAHTGGYYGTYEAETADDALIAMMREYGSADDVPSLDDWAVQCLSHFGDARTAVLDQAEHQTIDTDLFDAVVNEAARAVWFKNVPVQEAIEQAAIKLGA